MNKISKYFWGLTIIVAIILAYIIPYTLLSDVPRWNGSFLYWGITGVVIIIANLMLTKDWSN